MKLLLRIPFIIFLFLSVYSIAQTTTYWPYSVYGIGDIKLKGFGQSKAMGGVGIALPSKSSLNNVNPASYQGIDSLTFLLEMGLDARQSRFSNGVFTQNNSNFNFSYFAIGFRASNKWACSVGLAPYSTIGADINTKIPVEGSNDLVDVNFAGTGGINQLYWGNSFHFMKNLTLGVNISYLFGSITQTQSFTIPGVAGGPSTNDNMYLGKLTGDFGFMYDFAVNKNIKGTVGGILSLPWNIGIRHEITNFGVRGDTLENNVETNSTFKLPLTYGVGAAMIFNNKITVSADYSTGLWSKSQSLQSNVRFVNSNSYNLGLEYLPSDAFNASYFKKIRYRVGARYANNYLSLNGSQFFDKAITGGLGLQILRNHLNANISFEIGNRGSKDASLINENYKTIMLNFTLSDFWFIKRKFN